MSVCVYVTVTGASISVSADQREISVRDNGTGIAALELVGQKHCTSKLPGGLDDLYPSHSGGSCVTTLGFRGEAPHLLTQVADVCLTTRTAQQTVRQR